ncbi:hypothetical protein DXG03_000264 [Asterophora parasitica]|uniref:DUF676 domain-containing protein n=1 Tax=Asterophora parasitica TaxID=117018 RepID=A0A9P7KHL6_9AGAR|nr:hypothetical protein DXG03_000264 [Asterophora parasitica]
MATYFDNPWSDPPAGQPSAEKTAIEQTPEQLLVVFVHGFKGTDQTFGEFPERLQHILTDSITDIAVQCKVFPAYETKGELNEAVIRFADWLTTLTVETEVASGGGAGKTNVVLCGHRQDMPPLAKDYRLHRVRHSCKIPLPPESSFRSTDTYAIQYFGIHPHVFKNGVTKAAEYASTAQSVGSAVFGAFAGFGASKATQATAPAPTAATSGGWGKWAGPAAYAVGGAILAGAAAGSAYYKREELGTGFTWATDHMKYVGNLWDVATLARRVEALINVEKEAGVTFRA